MFFSGDPMPRKRVDLGGRSSKELDREKFLEYTKLERNRRLDLRLEHNRRLDLRKQNQAAIKIQKCLSGRKAMEIEHSKVREQFYGTFGRQLQYVDRNCVGPDSGFLFQLFFFFNARNADDIAVFVKTCWLLQCFVQESGNIVGLFGGMNYSSKRALVDYRVKKFAFSCIQAVHQIGNQLKDKLSVTPEDSGVSTALLLKSVVLLIDPKLPWVCKIVGYLLQRNAFTLLRDLVLMMKESTKTCTFGDKNFLVERMLILIIPHIGRSPCICQNIDPRWSFSSQILTIPLLWHLFPYLKEVFVTGGLSQHYVHQMALCVQNHANVLPNDKSIKLPGCACLLGNIFETAGVALSQPDCSFEMATDLAAVTTFLMEALPPIKSLGKESPSVSEDDMITGDEVMEVVLNRDLEQQITDAIDSHYLLQVTNFLLKGIQLVCGSHNEGPDDKEMAAVGAACAFLHVTFNTLPLERIMTVLASSTELFPLLWNYMKWCHQIKKWPALAYPSVNAPGWLLPLAAFCSVYKHMLNTVDNEEFYQQEKPLSLKDTRYLIFILREALWQLLWVNPTSPTNVGKSVSDPSTHKKLPFEVIQNRVSIVAAEVFSQLQDWNNKRQFTPPSDFHADGVNDFIISQASTEGSREYEILKQAPFLFPFTSRVKIFHSQLATVRQRRGPHHDFTGNQLRIRRDYILEDAYNQMTALSEEDLQKAVHVTFFNEHGIQEAGIDGGGIFKDFMEKITRSAFDVQYGLFKETADHLLYPNPGSGVIVEQHLQFFHFLGTLLGKAMFEGILVDIPFATFFLSKLKRKYNYFNDLPSLDPELYRLLTSLKHFKGDISELELYFVIENNEYGKQTEEELLPGGKNIRVTKENVIKYIHLVSNHHLNFQIRQQSSHFLRGFQQLIQKDWIDIFNERDFQLLVSGSLDSLDFDDLRQHTDYSGGYHAEDNVIKVFWEVLKSFSLENQKKFFKFVTGSSRGPLLGFGYLEPRFGIQKAAGGASAEVLDRLPTSATCMNLLKLPPYRSKEQMKTKLEHAINAEAGFDLS